MPLSSIGYGHNPYGHPSGPATPFLQQTGFGYGDWAEEVLWRLLPAYLRAEDQRLVDQGFPLRGFIEALKPLFNDLIDRWRRVPDLSSALTSPEQFLRLLAFDLGADLNDDYPVSQRRAELLTAQTVFASKGEDRAYAAFALLDSLVVEVTALWSTDCDPANAVLTEDGPDSFIGRLDDTAADQLPCDLEFPGEFDAWPRPLVPVGKCRANKIRLLFRPVENPLVPLDAGDLRRIADRLLRAKPAHIEIDRIVFDGLRGASPIWTIQGLDAQGIAASPVWTAVGVLGDVRAASPVWTAASVAADTV